jgi:hypothetical protein
VFKEIITVCSESHVKQRNKNAELLIVNAGGTYLPLGFKELRMCENKVLRLKFPPMREVSDRVDKFT